MKNVPKDTREMSMNGSLDLVFIGLLYHIVFLFLFWFLGIKEMFYFNIGSVVVFVLCAVLVAKTQTDILPFSICLVEVMLHQIFAEKYIGVNTNFHVFMLIMASTSFIVFRSKMKLGLIFCIIPSIGFIVMEMLKKTIVPVYTLTDIQFHSILFINVSCFVYMTIYRIFTYAKKTYNLEYDLKNKVHSLAQEMQKTNEDIICMQNSTIDSLSNLVEHRDSDTGKHVQRTSAYVKLLATEAKNAGLFTDYLTDDNILLLERAAPMHDIGKILISDVILNKPGRLTNEEFIEMQKHTTEGGKIVKEVLGINSNKEYLQMAVDIATCHHEKWNGTGYPLQKKEEEIPLCARIMAIADVFDALVSERCYKTPMSDDEAFDIIKKDAGIHFDPDLANVFVQNRAKVEKIKNIFRD